MRHTQSNRTGRRGVAVALAAVLVASCSANRHTAAPTTTGATGNGDTTTTAGGAASPPPGTRLTWGPAGRLAVRLSKGAALSAAASGSPSVVAGRELTAEEIAAVTGRLPAFADGATAAAGFAWPAATLPVPRAGVTTNAPFPASASASPAPVATGALAVSRVQPEGDVPIAPFVAVTFNQPMVPVATIAQLDAAAVPARVSPAVAGRWRWVGTQTLRFDADRASSAPGTDRLPMATEFTVTIPAGTASVSGAALASARSFTFRTPPPTVQAVQPAADSTLPLAPVFVLAFDQKIDAAALLPHVHLTAADKGRDLRLATAAEIAAASDAGGDNGGLTSGVTGFAPIAPDRLVEGHWIAVRPVDDLPKDAAVALTVERGAPSAEGPLTTTEAHTERFRTYPPLAVRRVDCGVPECPPGAPISIELSNPLDASVFDTSQVTLDPAVPNAAVSLYGNTVSVQGDTKARTTYRVTLSPALRDVFGQTPANDERHTVKVGDPVPQLLASPPFVTLDPTAPKPVLTIRTVNHKAVRLRLFTVKPADWPAFVGYLTTLQQNTPTGEVPNPPWKPAVDRVVTVDGDATAAADTTVDLGNLLGNGGLGHVVALVEPTERLDQNDQAYWMNRPFVTWLQSTRLGLDAIVDDAAIRIWATELATGVARSGASIAAMGRSGSVTTGDDGLARFPSPGTENPVTAFTATSGDDVAILPHDAFGGGWYTFGPQETARWYVADDRHTYRPGETVSVTGFVRRLADAGDGRSTLASPGTETVSYSITDQAGIALGSGTAELTPLGGFSFTAELPDGANEGTAFVNLQAPSLGATGHQFVVQSFRRPEVAVTARTETTGPLVSAKPATLAADAAYYAGGAVGGAPVTWTVTTANATYSPPGWRDWSFGRWIPWWSDATTRGGFGGFGAAADVGGFPGAFPDGFATSDVRTFSDATDAAGASYLKLDFTGATGVLPDLPVTVRADAAVTDVNRQVVANSTNVLVHPADLYVGLRGAQIFVRRGDPLDVQVIVTSIDGKPVAGRKVTVKAERLTWSFTNGSTQQTATDAKTCDTTSAADAVTCSFATNDGGEYRLTATVQDDNGATSRTEMTRWVAGATAKAERGVSRQTLNVVPARADYRPGDTAEVLVQAPFANGHGVMTVGQTAVGATVPFDLADGSAVVRLPLGEADVPGLSLQFDVAGTAPRTGDDGRPLAGAPERPAVAVGTLTLPVSVASRTLAVTATPSAATATPGAPLAVDVSVHEPGGAPSAGAQVSLAVVDEAVLALGAYRWPDPVEVFYPRPQRYQQDTYGREYLELADPTVLGSGGVLEAAGGATGAANSAAATTVAAAAGGSPAFATVPFAPQAAGQAVAKSAAADVLGTSAGVNGQAAPGIDVRTNFDALAVFAPAVATDAAGNARVSLTLPDNLTRYRVMAVAAAGDDRFGSAEATVTARKPLMVRPSAPRFANFGDRFELPVVVQNQTDHALTTDVVLQGANLTIEGSAGRRVDVAANDRIEVRFPVAASAAGTARLRVAAASDALGDAATVTIPVYTPVTTEAFATYGVLDDGAVAQPVAAPTGVVPAFGGLDVTTSSTIIQGLTDALVDIIGLPYESVDARAGRILSITALRGVLADFHVPGLPDRAALDATMRADVAAIAALVNPDNGLPYWELGRPSDPYLTVYGLKALVAAEQAGITVPQDARFRLLDYVRGIESRYPPGYGQAERDATDALALAVRAEAGERDSTKAEAMWRDRGSALGLDAAAWLWPVIDDATIDTDIARRITNAAVDTAGAVTFTSGYADGAYLILQSQRRFDAVVLDALVAHRPASDLIPKIVVGLLAQHTGASWSSTQESAFVLGALKHYYDRFESATPAFVARVWLGDRLAGESSARGRSTDRQDVAVPMADLQAAAGTGATAVTVGKDGAGRLYYRVGLRYAPSDLATPAVERGFVVQRSYEPVDHPDDVTRDVDGTWHVKAGANVRVRVTMVAESRRTHVALVDPLPAGLEIVNPDLATAPDLPGVADPSPGPLPVDAGGIARAVDARYCCWQLTWYDHQNRRDDRAEAFATFLPAGAYDYSYVARATTPGTFVVPAPRAEEIYAPETFGHGRSDRLTVDA